MQWFSGITKSSVPQQTGYKWMWVGMDVCVYRNSTSKIIRGLWIVFYHISHQHTRSILSNASDKRYFTLLLPSRTDSCPYMGDAHQYPCLCWSYKEFNVNLSCLRDKEQTNILILHLTFLNVLKGLVPSSCFNNSINRVKISEIKIEICCISYEREGSKGVCHTAWQQGWVQSWVISFILYSSHAKGI